MLRVPNIQASQGAGEDHIRRAAIYDERAFSKERANPGERVSNARCESIRKGVPIIGNES